MYEGVLTSVWTHTREMNNFHIIIGLHQCLTLSPYLFILIFDVLKEHLQKKLALRCMFFCIWYSSTWRIEQKFKWNIRDGF